MSNYYAGELSDLKIKRIPERDLQAELFKDRSPKQIVDEYEESIGRKPKKEIKLNLKNKIQYFNIKDEEDKILFEELMNNPKYNIIHYRDTFTVGGDHRIVCIYSEDLDYDKNKEKEKKNHE